MLDSSINGGTPPPGAPDNATYAPVTYYNGRPVVTSTDLSFDSSGTSFDWVRGWTGTDDSSLNGNGWMVDGLPYLTIYENQYSGDGYGIVDAIFSPSVQRRFDLPQDSMSGIQEEGFGQETMTWAAPTNVGGVNTPGEFHLTDDLGDTIVFYDLPRAFDNLPDGSPMTDYGRLYGGAGYTQQITTQCDTTGAASNPYPFGAFKSFTDAYGNTENAVYDSTGHLVDLVRTDAVTGAQQQYALTYTDGVGSHSTLTNAEGGNATMIASVTLQERSGTAATWINVRSASYDYYNGDTSYGRLGDLKTVTIKDANDAVLDQKYYRYETVGGTTETSWTGYDKRSPVDSPTTSGTASPVMYTGYSGPTVTVVQSALTAVVEDDAYARLATADGSNVDLWPSDLTQYAQHTFQYEGFAASDIEAYSPSTWWRVTQETATGEGCSSCSAGVGTFDYTYATRNVDGVLSLPGNDYYGIGGDDWLYNDYAVKTTVSLPDDTSSDPNDNDQEIAYTNFDGQVILRVLIDKNGTDSTADDKMYGWYYKYDSTGRLIMAADPSAVNLGYGLTSMERFEDLVGGSSSDTVGGTYRFLNSTGRIHIYTYGSSDTGTETTGGDATGYLSSYALQRGASGTPTTIESYTYLSHTNNVGGAVITVHPIASDTMEGASSRTTNYAYTWYAGDHALQAMTVTMTAPAVTSTQNGSASGTNGLDISIDALDNFGRVIFHKDGDGYITYNQYDAVNFGLAKHIDDADTTASGDFTTSPTNFAGISSLAGSHLSLTTTYVNDRLGRTTLETSPAGNVVFTTYNDAAHEVRMYSGSMSGTNFTQVGPTLIDRQDWAGGYTEDLTLVATPTVNALGYPTGQEAITSSGIRTLSRSGMNNAGQVVEKDKYFTFGSGSNAVTYAQGAGSFHLKVGTTSNVASVNFNATTYGYDSRGRLSRVKDPNGTITRTVYNASGNPVSEWVGTNDTPASGYWAPSGTQAAGMVDVKNYYYDNVNDVSQLPYLTAPAAATGTQGDPVTPGGPGGSYYWVLLTYVDANGRESIASPSAPQYVSPSYKFIVDSPATPTAMPGITGYNVYVIVSSGYVESDGEITGEMLQNSTPIPLGTTFTVDAGALANIRPLASYSIGDNNLTRTVEHPTTNAASFRVTETQYDWRDRPVITKSGVLLNTTNTVFANPGGETDLANRLITYNTYDNLDEVTETDSYAGDGYSATGSNGVVIDVTSDSSPGTPDGVPDAPDSSRLRAKTVVSYDDQGRPYRSSVFSVNPSSGTASAGSLDTNVFYNHRGLVMDQVKPGGLAVKSIYDGAGRLTAQYETDGGATGTSPGTPQNWSNAASLSNDLVLQQVETRYDGDSNIILTVTKQRAHDYTGTGPLSGAAADPSAPQVVSRQLFYNNSSLDGNSTSANTSDFNAIATNRVALLPGQNAAALTTSAVSGYTKGINGIIVDIANLPAGVTLSASDFTFKVGNDNNPSGWSAAPTPAAVTTFAGDGVNGSTRIEITWADSAIENEWLQVSVKANANTGLATPDVFYYGNQIGDANGDGTVDIADYGILVANYNHTVTGGPSVGDFDGNGTVYSPDVSTYIAFSGYSISQIATSAADRVAYQTSYYDSADRLTDSIDYGTNGSLTFNRPSSAPTSSTDAALLTHVHYNDAGWQDVSTDPRGIESETYYDMLGRTTRTVAAWDGSTSETPGSSPTVGTSTNQVTDYTYDGDDHVVTQTAWNKNGTNAATFQTTAYIYGVSPSDTKPSAVSSNDLLAKVEYPDLSTGNASTNAANIVSFSYLATGDEATKTDQNQTTHAYGYDSLGRLTSDAITAFGTGVDTAVAKQTFAFNDAGDDYLNSSLDGSGNVANQEEMLFDGLGNVVRDYQSAYGPVTSGGVGGRSVQYAYDFSNNHDRLVEMIYPNGRILHYGYSSGLDDAISRADYLADDNGSGSAASTHLVNYSYLGDSTVVIEDRPEEGIELSYVRQSGDTLAGNDGGDQFTGLDRFGRVDDQNWITDSGGTPTTIDRVQSGHDRDGNVLYDRNLSGTAGASFSMLFAYDNLNRLTTSSRGTLNSGNTAIATANTIAGSTESWNLDAQGNWSSQTVDGTTTGRTTNGQNELTGVGSNSLTYDASGNTLTDGSGSTYTYDAWNRLISATIGYATDTYAYLPGSTNAGQYSSSAGINVRLYYSTAGQVIQEVNGNGGANTQYVWGLTYVNDLILRDKDADANSSTGSLGKSGSGEEERTYAIRDANHDVIAITGQTGTMEERFTYDPYGNVTALDGSWAASSDTKNWLYLYQGGRKDAFSGLYLFGAREYSATLGRWLQQDPGGYIDGASRYQFVLSNPFSYVDPTGWGAGPIGYGSDRTKNLSNLQGNPLPRSGSSINVDVVPLDMATGGAACQHDDRADWAILLSLLYAQLADAFGPDRLLTPSSPDDMINQLVNTGQQLAASGNSIGTITFRGHGSKMGAIWAGPDPINDTLTTNKLTQQNWKNKLSKLKPYLGKNSRVTLWACDVGQDPAFGQNLADILGVPVDTLTVTTLQYLEGHGQWITAYPGGTAPSSSGGGGKGKK